MTEWSRNHGSKRNACISRIPILPAHRGMRMGFRNLTGAGPARRRGLDRAGGGEPRLAPLWPVARSPDQRARAARRYGLACADDRADTEFGANAGRHILGNYRGGPPTIKTCPRFHSLWEVFGGYREPYSEYPVLPCSPGHSHPTGVRWLNATPGRRALNGVKRYSTVASVAPYSEDTSTGRRTASLRKFRRDTLGTS